MKHALPLDALIAALFVGSPWFIGARGAAMLPGLLRGVARPLGGFVVGVSLVVWTVIGLGTAGMLTRPAAAVVLVAFLAASVGIGWIEARRAPGGAGLLAPLTSAPRSSRDAVEVALLCFLATLGAQLLALVLLNGWREPPLAYDALMYHLLFPIEWIRNRALVLVPTYFAAPANSYFPCNAEATFAFTMLGTGSETLVNLAQLPFLLAGGLALSGIARRCSLGKRASAFIGLLFIASPEVVTQAGSALVDVQFAAEFLLAVFFLLEWRQTHSLAAAACAGLSAGLLAGTKSLGLLFCLLLCPLVGLALLRRNGHGPAPGLRGAALLVLAAVPSGSFWYLRNWWITGNPVFPLQVQIGDRVLFPGAHGRLEMLQSHFHIPPFHAESVALSKLWGPTVWVPLLILVVLASLLPALPRLLARGSARAPLAWQERIVRGTVLVLPALMLAAFSRINPYNSQYRFLLAAYALSLIPVGAALDGARRFRWLFAGCAVACVGGQLALWGGPSDPRLEVFPVPLVPLVTIALAVSGGVVILARARGRATPLRHPGVASLTGWAGPAVAAILAALLTLLHPLVARDYLDHAGESPEGQKCFVWGTLRRSEAPRVIAYTGFNQPTPLFGEDLRNRVVYVAVDGRQGYNLHDYLRLAGGSSGLRRRTSYKPAYYRQQAAPEAWLRGLDELGVDLLVVSRLTAWDREEFEHDADGFPWEEGWARSRGGRFEPLLSTSDMRVYGVIRR